MAVAGNSNEALSSLVEGDEGSYWFNCQINLVIGSKAYHLGI